MVNEIINIVESDSVYNDLVKKITSATDDDLVIVARNIINRKNDCIEPIIVKNGIYFYVAHKLNNMTAYPKNVTVEQIYKAIDAFLKL